MEMAALSRKDALVVRLTGENKDTATEGLLLWRDVLEERLNRATDLVTLAGLAESIARIDRALAALKDYL